MFQHRFATQTVALMSSLLVAACMPVADESETITESLPAVEPRQPAYRSDKRLSSDCGVEPLRYDQGSQR